MAKNNNARVKMWCMKMKKIFTCVPPLDVCIVSVHVLSHCTHSYLYTYINITYIIYHHYEQSVVRSNPFAIAFPAGYNSPVALTSIASNVLVELFLFV